ncbi:MAG TPA: M56 family metallopeptidase [Terriglobales bacterium]|nr:M56 family metallopeptidase [Terriglobales bacterium]
MISTITQDLARLAPGLVTILAKSSLLLLLALACARVLRRASASLRHCLYAAAMAGALLVLPAAFLLPGLNLAVLPSSTPTISKVASSVLATATVPIPAHADAMTAQPQAPRLTRPRRVESTATSTPVASQNGTQITTSLAAPVTPFYTRWSVPGLLILLWLAGSGLIFVRFAISRLQLHALVSRAVPVQSIPLASHLRWLCRDLGIRREVTVLASVELDVPIAVGLFDPRIVLSPQSEEWTETRRQAVLCHELAHIQRLDAWTQLLGVLAMAIYWFNPLVWIVSRLMRADRERACDDVVLAFGTPASEYAHELLEIVSTLVRPQPAAALAMARRSQLEGRVLSLLNPKVAHNRLPSKAAVLLSGAVVAVALPLAAAQLQERPAPVVASAPSASTTSSEGTKLATVATSNSWNETAGLHLPVYPQAVAIEHRDGRGTVSLIGGAHVRSLRAEAYLSRDKMDKVLPFYRERMKQYGKVIECAGGANDRVDVRLDPDSIAHPGVCRADEFATDGTELKVVDGDARLVTVVRSDDQGSEIALVSYTPGTAEDTGAEVWQPAATDVHGRMVEVASHSISDSAQSTSPSQGGCLDSHNVENVSSHSHDGAPRLWAATWSGPGCSIDARSSGEVRFSPDAMQIESISSGGSFEVTDRNGENVRYLKVDPTASGQLNYTYRVNGNAQPFDAAARSWFSGFLLAMERATGFAADTRVPALLAKGGPQAVLAEIPNLTSDYVRQIYFTKLFENATLSGPQLTEALNEARSEISTDYSLAQVLLTIARRYDLNDEGQRVAFLNAANKLKTDYEHSRVLIELLKRPNLSPQIVGAALESAKTISTDYEKGRILTTLVGLGTFNENEIGTYLDLANSIGTDYEHSRVLMALMEKQKLSPAAVTQVLKSAAKINTDYEKSRILLAVNDSPNFDEKQVGTYLTLVDSISTDYERSRDLIALMQHHKLASDSVARIIAESARIGTDYEKARVLTEAAQRYPMQGATREAYIKAANSIGTEYDRNRTLAAITKGELL